MADNPVDEVEDSVVSSVSDLGDTPLSALVEQPASQTDAILDRVLDLEANGLLTAASFNASI